MQNNTDTPIRNATDFFAQPSRTYHHSESFWTSVFALSLLTITQAVSRLDIPAFVYKHRGKEWDFEENGSLSVTSPLMWHEIVVEGRIGPGLHSSLGVPPNEVSGLRPDIFIRRDNRITIIEVKTIGHSLGLYQKMCCEKLAAWLREQGCTVDLFYLISAGHESRKDWELFRNSADDMNATSSRLLLWEVVFDIWLNHDQVRNMMYLLPDISKYISNPASYLRGREA